MHGSFSLMGMSSSTSNMSKSLIEYISFHKDNPFEGISGLGRNYSRLKLLLPKLANLLNKITITSAIV